MPRPTLARAGRRDRLVLVGQLIALGLLGVLTGFLGTAQHLAREGVAGVVVPYGLLLALALVVVTDLAVALATTSRGRTRGPGPARGLLAVAAGRGASLGLLLLPTSEGDVVLTGLPESTVWILVAVLLPAFVAPMATAVDVARRPRATRAT